MPKSWDLKEIAEGFEKFYKEYGKYPSATEIDDYSELPSARSIQRQFGGLVSIRAQLKLKTQSDLRTGAHSSERAIKINRRANRVEKEVYTYLVNKFGNEFVHREYFFSDDKRTRADFFVHDRKGGFCVDVFYPSDTRNLAGCLNSKQKKYDAEMMRRYPIIFLQMNEQIDTADMVRILENKKNNLKKGQDMMGWQAFQDFCATRKALKIDREDGPKILRDIRL